MSQKNIVLKEIRARGFVSRNWCLSNHISRLGAIIHSLKREGYQFNTNRGQRISDDYSYHLVK